MRLIHVNQGSPSWHQLRMHSLGASDCAKVMGTRRQRRMLFYEKSGLSTPITAAMQWGKDYESKARAFFSKHLESEFCPVVIQHPTIDWMIASLDGWDAEQKVMLEIKVVGATTFAKALARDFPKQHLWQIQHQWAVNDEAKCALLGYYFITGDWSVQWVLQPIDRDQDMIDELMAKEAAFMKDHVWAFKSPEV
jgi:putative phage-type endonuclease